MPSSEQKAGNRGFWYRAVYFPELFLVRLEKGVLLGIEKAGLEKKIPQ
jgi:hypothetical protein